ncbi:UDP-N-acetylglucosamine 1-carboxyvinyltransferase [Pseudomonas sp. JV241A]|uniref:UDP-N-acetylglucosamine 1-carboxyvinyltransferase n=1 Tax=Pseudomonas sp. JV241A TaxID=2078785 RepID=UPI00100D4C1B|nr:UDP-N-acetylglucosamine 1-carboxyvinyltransferase [Pseudomonas sp. JV241A]SPO65139.1 putative UDP-N-acetylglucosamine 1-carboxyvinyltransferase [Pseudomonas sp. JV241A]
MSNATVRPLGYDLELISTIYISHSKNSVLPLLVASLMVNDISIIAIDGDHIDDVRTMIDIIQHLGAHCIQEKNRLIVDARDLQNFDANIPECSSTRYSLLLLGALSARLGKSKVALPGGCDLNRPFDFHITCLEAFGNEITVDNRSITCIQKHSPKTEFSLPYPSVGTTLQAIFSTVIGDSRLAIIIRNTALEPEIDDVIAFLNKAGAKVFRDDSNITVIPVGRGSLSAVSHEPIHDRIEASSYAFAAVATRKVVLLKNCPVKLMTQALTILEQLKCIFYIQSEHDILVDGRSIEESDPISVVTQPYPGFPTDLQPILAALCCTLKAVSHIRDEVMPHRTGYVKELEKIGALISSDGNKITIMGFESLSNAVTVNVSAPDLRGGMAIIILAISNGCDIRIESFNQILRGYSRIISNAHILGGAISHEHP